jgi:hypothetical protein
LVVGIVNVGDEDLLGDFNDVSALPGDLSHGTTRPMTSASFARRRQAEQQNFDFVWRK